MQEAKDESKTQREACSVCGAESRRECPCGTRRYCSVSCQLKDWTELEHKPACLKLREEIPERPTRPPSPLRPVYGEPPPPPPPPQPPRPTPEQRMAFARAQDDSTRCPVCEEIFDPNYYKHHVFRVCCCKLICERCDIGVLKATAPLCPLCESPAMTHAEELALLRQRVDEHEPNAMVQLGHKHQRGEAGLERDDAAALALYQRAADYGDLRAMVHLGLAYVNSRGTPKDERLDGPAQQRRDRQKGVDLLRLGAERGDAHCQYCLAVALLEKDELQEAVIFLELAADQKYAKAEFTAGACHLQGLGVPEDEDKALRWFLRAAYRGHNEARQAVGVIRRHRPDAPEFAPEARRLAEEGAREKLKRDAKRAQAKHPGWPEWDDDWDYWHDGEVVR